MVKLTVVPVIPLALSEARKTAMFAISSSVISRRGWVLLASDSCHCSQVIPDAFGARLEGVPDRACLRHALWSQTDHADALGCELGG
jgi:hypothetical protein